MAVTFHVFVDSAVDASPAGLNKLAVAMSARYGLPAGDLIARLSKGRFRVKANVDQATADTYLRDLSAIGARCTIEPTNAPAGARATTPPGAPATTPPAPVRAASALPPRAAPGTATPRPSAPPAAGNYQSGLAAAFSAESAPRTPSANLGALAGDLSSFSLGSVDGVSDDAPSAAAFVPPPVHVTSNVSVQATAARPAKAPTPPRSKDEPLDLFAPPGAQEEADFKVDLAPEDEARAARKRMSTPPPMLQVEAPAPALNRRGSPGTPSTPPSNQPITARRLSPHTASPNPESRLAARPATGAGAPRGRFAAGVVLAILIGFVPAHLVAASRERSAFRSVDDKVELAQQQADSPDTYAALDRLRDEQLGRKESERRSIMLMALGIWAIVGSGIAYVWFRRIPWDR